MTRIYDPFANIFRLALINYLPKGTKIHLEYGCIQYDYPTFFQGILRYIKGSSANDIGELRNVIYLLCLWKDEISDDFEFIRMILIRAIDQLIELYSERDVVSSALYHYKNLLQRESTSSLTTYNPIYDSIRKLWLVENRSVFDLMIRYLYILEKEKCKGGGIDSIYIDGAITILETMTRRSEKLIKEIAHIKEETDSD